ncbi:hypothetical protein [Haloarcula nitratireducens]|uniref:Uncharacterized protein n=1 Tax=Haloarcula nitratireducens TaxID=2487749 RepID=A0AAW4PJE8_9EURY|nr:hypothetical protein [Halomicroarcula nitratireducens]MBX0298155.1 hypothetical protein [Halomicroarcula nitratireducens]
MTDHAIRDVVEQKRAKLLDDSNGLNAAAAAHPHAARTIGVGLLALDEVVPARDWFRALAQTWIATANDNWEAKYKTGSRADAVAGPWREYIRGLYSAVLAGHNVERTVSTVLERTTASFVETLDKRQTAQQLDLARALSSTLVDDTATVEHVRTLRQNLETTGTPARKDHYEPYIRIVQHLNWDNDAMVAYGVHELVMSHGRFRDADIIRNSVAYKATALLALARRAGASIAYSYETIPDAVNGDTYYPVVE